MKKFEEVGVNPEILKAISELGFVEPTPIQEQTIPYLLSNSKDLIANAQTGTGKTAAFGLPIVQNSDEKSKKVQSIILSPTRELCVQIAKDMASYSKYSKDISVVPVYGGASMDTQIRALKKGAQVVVGTPGRVNDLIRRKKLILSDVRWVVLDEADEMLNMGFKDDIDTILGATPKERQTLLFSATMPKGIMAIAKKYMNNPDEISVGKKNVGATNVEHQYYVINAKDRYLTLKRVVDVHPNIYGIIFCRTRRETKDIADKLMQEGYNADALHGDLSQAQRDNVMTRFRKKHLQILVATDVAARGLDVNDLTHIINYNLPDDIEAYIHRSGRTGRAGKKGNSIVIIHTREQRKLQDLEKIVGKKFEKKLVPSGDEVCEKQLYKLIDTIENIKVDDAKIDKFIPAITKKLEWLSREDLIKHFVSAEFNRFLDYYKGAKDLNILAKERNNKKRDKRKDNRGDKDRGDNNRGRRNENFSRFHISVGSNKGIKPVNIIGLINDNCKQRGIEIGKIDIMRNFGFFEVDSKHEKDILKGFKNTKFKGEEISVQIAKEPKKNPKSEDNTKVKPKRKRKNS
ncbi:MAG: DEAD/DEAH box helicase [Bacteroidota bacterium]|nr:DEAD/DEAH box helicase [Bacteroidota bacterium]